MKIQKFLPVLVLGCGLTAAAVYVGYKNDNIRITEVCGNNQDILLEDGSCSDYVELYNGGSRDASLDSFYLSDERGDLKKYSLEGIRIPAGGYVTISFSDITTFGLNKKGETVYLSDRQGNIVDSVSFFALEKNQVYARVSPDSEEWKIAGGTPGMANDTTIFMVEAPLYSVEGGFFEEPFYLEMQAAEETTIYYTLDGSIPDEQSLLYEEPVYVYDRSEEPNVYRNVKNMTTNWSTEGNPVEPVDKCFVVRAVAVDKEGNKSKVTTASYFVDKEDYQERTVVSLVADPEVLFGDNGIYVTGKAYDDWYLGGQVGEEPEVNFEKRGREYEVAASVEFLEQDLIGQQDVGIRIQGASTRGSKTKRFSLFSRDEYSGSGVFEADLFGGKKTHSLVLRESFANAFLNTLVEERAVGTLQGRPVSVFLNGEFWYDTYLLEKYSERFMQETYGVEKENVVIVKNGELEDGIDGDYALYQEMLLYFDDHDLSSETDYLGFCEKADMQSYIDFLCTNIYLCNMDYNDNKNCMLWRVREPGSGQYNDGKWRWLLYDTDAIEWGTGETYGVAELAAVDSFSEQPPHCERPINQQYMYTQVKQSPIFRKQFVLTFMDMVNTCFSVDNVSEKLEQWGQDISWNAGFFEKRAAYIVPCLAKEFGLTGTLEPVSISTNNRYGGDIRVNTTAISLQEENWQGHYFTDYPITVTATEKPGYRFVGWSGSLESVEKTIQVDIKEGGIKLHAVFEKIR